MDLVKARKRAKQKAGEEEKKKKSGKKGKAGAVEEQQEKPAAPEEVSPQTEEAAPEPAPDDVFMDDSFGEDLPFEAPEEETDEFILDESGPVPGRDFEMPDEEKESPQTAEPVPEKAKREEEVSAPEVEKSRSLLEEAEEDDWRVSDPKQAKSKPLIQPDWEEEPEDIWTLERMAEDDEDFFALVTEDLYMKEFGQEDEAAAGETLELLSFRLAQEVYAVRLTSIRQIIKLMPVTLVPRAPEYVLGIVSLRGTIIPVFDLRKRLGLSAGEATRKSRIIVVANEKYSVGLIVDEVEMVIRLHESAVEPPPTVLAGVESEFIEGIGRVDRKMIILLDLEKLLVPVTAGKRAKAV